PFGDRREPETERQAGRRDAGDQLSAAGMERDCRWGHGDRRTHAHCRAPLPAGTVTRPLRPTARPLIVPSSVSITYCQESSYSPVSPAYRPVPPVIVPTTLLPVPIGSPRSWLKTLSPRSSVHTAWPVPPALLSENPMASP